LCLRHSAGAGGSRLASHRRGQLAPGGHEPIAFNSSQALSAAGLERTDPLGQIDKGRLQLRQSGVGVFPGLFGQFRPCLAHFTLSGRDGRVHLIDGGARLGGSLLALRLGIGGNRFHRLGDLRAHLLEGRGGIRLCVYRAGRQERHCG
jgi:hypothetical protein